MQEVVTVAPDRLANYEQKKREFFKEHLHEHEEIRLILEGSGKELGVHIIHAYLNIVLLLQNLSPSLQ